MGSYLSLPSTGTRTGSARPPPGPFLELPVDIILHLCCNYLPPASAVALSLTCKSLFGLISSQAKTKIQLNSTDLETLLLLLEKDSGHRWYYCHNHTVLHCFSQDSKRWALRSWLLYRDQDDCRLRNLASVSMSTAAISYHHVRLAMNRHFYGAPNGISLDMFQLKTTLVAPWREQWSARIIGDELFLSATRTLPWTDQQPRYAVVDSNFGICGHVRTVNSLILQYTVDTLHPTPTTPTNLFVPCHEVFESCHKCLTDYDTVVEQRQAETSDPDTRDPDTNDQTRGNKCTRVSWSITVTSYHRLGAGRSPSDPKWHAFATRGYATIGFSEYHRIQRDMVRYPPGSVRQAWKEAEQFMS
ncbi:hypothetical protein QBC37DRAFT_436460 [Rhypophila decipiens]|uniref:F-box domain-containing protein n=1 Tax=Rhypophila decipiens TaxID=261697 RepID=A0AAN7BDD4_9PEZI|nr:hypothetical protein QBC37DRAFT_436460 [Rhypophila decipiens]